jgi:ketosteroid isomerase-like protein
MAETQELKRAATRFYDRLNDALRMGRLDLLDDVLAPEAIDHNPVPGMGPGQEGIKKAFAEGRQAFSDMRVTVEATVAEGDKVAWRVVVRDGPQWGISGHSRHGRAGHPVRDRHLEDHRWGGD